MTRFSYAASEVGGQLIFCVISFYLLKFYTDVYGISAGSAGFILLVARFIDAFDAPLWGFLFEKTRSHFGSSRPWFLWLCGPFALFGVLTFVTPPLSALPKIVYAASTYVCCSILYTGINTPVTSILSALTTETRERAVLTTFRMFGSKLGVLFVNLTVLRLVAFFGRGNDRRGFMLVMPIYAVCSVIMFLIAFRNLRETVVNNHSHVSIKGSLSALRGNRPWLIIFLSSLFFWIAFIARISAAPFYFQYALHRPDLVPIANSFDVISLVSIFFLPWMVCLISKRTLWSSALSCSALAQIVIFSGTLQRSTAVVFLGWILGFLASGIAMAMPFSLLSDSIDYGEWKSGVRAAGLLTAIGAAFCLKAGSGLGGALPAWILAHYHYVPNAVQTPQSLYGIEASFIWLPAISYAIAVIPVLFYHRYERMEPLIQRTLQERRELAAIVGSST